MPLLQNGAKTLSEMPLLHQDVLTEKSEDKPKIPEHLSKSDLDFFFYLINDCAGRMLKVSSFRKGFLFFQFSQKKNGKYLSQ